MSGTRSKSGLVCSHGSELDTIIPRPPMPKRALPPDIRRKLVMNLSENRPNNNVISEDEVSDAVIWKAGAGVLAPVGSAPDGSFLKRGSGVPMSERASALAQMKGLAGMRAVIPRARLAESNALVKSSGRTVGSIDMKTNRRLSSERKQMY